MKKLLNLKSALGFLVLMFLLVSIPISLSLMQSRQEIRKEAAGTGFSLSLTSAQTRYYFLPSPNQPVFDVQIQLATGNNNVRGADISLKFDQNYLEVVDADTVTAGIQVTPGTIFPNQQVLENQANNTNGIILLSLGTFSSYTGTSVYGTIKFKAKQSISSTQILFNPVPYTKVTAVGGENLVTTTPTGLTLQLPLDTLAPSVPAPSSPANNWLTNQNPLTPTFTWAAAVDNETSIASYGIQVDNENTFTSPFIYENTVITGTSSTLSSALTTNGPYYWRVKAIDKAGNISAWSTNQTFTIDSLVPATIALTTLAGTPATSAVNLSWISPNANPGTVASYEIRYSTANITAANWTSATLVSRPPAPTAPGTTQTKTVSSLTPGTVYYFAIKSKDSANNISALSNVPNITTAQLPTKLSFTLKIQGLTLISTTAKPNVLVSFILKNAAGTIIFQKNDVTLKNVPANGTYTTSATLDLGIIPSGSYQVFIKGTSHLRKNMTSATPLSLINGDNVANWSSQILLAGDIDITRDDRVDSSDFEKLARDYVPNTPANSPADFNLDGRVDASDFEIFARNYLKTGD